MLWLALITILFGCIMVPIIFVILGIWQRPLDSREGDSIQSELDQRALLRSHGYEIGEKIGEGSYANVRRAYSIDDKKEVAVKIVNKLREVKTIIVTKI